MFGVIILNSYMALYNVSKVYSSETQYERMICPVLTTGKLR